MGRRDRVPGGAFEGAAILSGTVNTHDWSVDTARQCKGFPKMQSCVPPGQVLPQAANMAQNTMGKQMLTHHLVYSSQVSWLLLASPRDQKGHFSLVGVLEFKLFL